jgi:hypothetical protein
MQDPLGVGYRRVDARQVRQVDRIDQDRSRSGPPQLHQIRPLAVSVAGGSFGVNGDRPVSGGKAGDGLGKLGRGGDRLRGALAWSVE